MIALIQRHKRYTALLNIPGQLPTHTPSFEACDVVQAARVAIRNWAEISDITEVLPLTYQGGILS